MYDHSKAEGGWLCEATGKVAPQVWTCHGRWKECGHSMNECKHCNPGGHQSIGSMLHALNEKAKKEAKR